MISTAAVAPDFTMQDKLKLALTAVPPVAVSLFVAGIKPQTPEEIAMASLMLSSTALLLLFAAIKKQGSHL